MKKIKIILLVVFIVVLEAILFMQIGNNKKIKFNNIKLIETNTSSTKYVYEIKLQDDALSVEHYCESDIFKNNKYVPVITSIHKALLSLDEYEKLNSVLNENNVYKWKGWHKTNPFILDGGGFQFVLETKDGEIIEASGINASPKNYGIIYDIITNLCTNEVIKDSDFVCNKFKTKLPEEWIGMVNVRYAYGYLSFYLKLDDNECSLLNVYYNDYGYYDGDEYIHLGEKRVGSNKEYLFCAKGDSIDIYKDKMNDKQSFIIKNLDSSINDIIQNLKY